MLHLLAPVGGRLFRDELDVEEGPLARAIVVSGRSTAHDSWRHVRHDVLIEGKGLGDGESPSGFEAATHHRPRRRGRRRGQAERVGEAEAAYLEETEAQMHLTMDTLLLKT